jgi:hypothetical protein
MADVGLNPPKAGIVHARTGIMTDALAKFGSVVISAATGNHADVVTTTGAGSAIVLGVVQSQGDPNNSGLFAVGDEATVVDIGDVQILVLGGVTYAVGDQLITSATAGVAKKLAAETGAMVIATSLQAVTTGTNPQLISARMTLYTKGS